ncbi:hypothetical protein KJZ61_00030 [Candidatus Dependentiae bacterium]|nr:hypothetical protein [Candidatus Dependentiae bacterium]
MMSKTKTKVSVYLFLLCCTCMYSVVAFSWPLPPLPPLPSPTEVIEKVGEVVQDVGKKAEEVGKGAVDKILSIATGELEKIKNTAHALALHATKLFIKTTQLAIAKNPHKDHVAHVRQGPYDLAQEERRWRDARFQKIWKAQERFLGMPLAKEEVLEVNFAFSGGGARAALGTIGFLEGAQEAGFLDCVMTTAGISGSTWALASWISSGLDIPQFREFFIKRLSISLIPTPLRAKNTVDNLLVKFCYEQPPSVVDLYGNWLANAFLGKNSTLDFGVDANLVYLASTVKNDLPSQVDRIATTKYPFPVYTAIQEGSHEFFEFTPFEVGCRKLEVYIPTWGFGRKFNNGHSVDNAPEQSLGYMLGIFGSAFSTTLNTYYDESAITQGIDAIFKTPEYIDFVSKTILEGLSDFPEPLRSNITATFKNISTTSTILLSDDVRLHKELAPIPDPARSIIMSMANAVKSSVESIKSDIKALLKDVGSARVLDAVINNFAFGLPRSTLANDKTIKLIDTGFGPQIPLLAACREPVHKRLPDIIFAFDFSPAEHGETIINGLMRDAESNDIHLPIPSDATNEVKKLWGERALTIFKSENHEVPMPILCYMPQVKDTTLITHHKNDSTYASYTNKLMSLDWAKEATSGYANTFRLTYKEPDANTVVMLTKFNILTQIEVIRNTMKERILAKRRGVQ